MDSLISENQEVWDKRIPYHLDSEFYNLADFKSGNSSLDPITAKSLSNISDKSLLHLQCHFGLDSLSLTRQGINVTGVDFSQEAIKVARNLSRELHLPATFIHCNLYEMPQYLSEQFDVVFTSHGVLSWLPDLNEWAKLIYQFLKPDGFFYIIEVHPFALLFDKNCQEGKLTLHHQYFRGIEPFQKKEQGSYAFREAPIKSVSYIWFHRLDEIIGSLLKAGLRITSFEEYPYMNWQFFQCMEKQSDGFWRLIPNNLQIPLMFSIKATKV